MVISAGTSRRVVRATAADMRIPFRDGMLSGDLIHPASLRLAGSRCAECGLALWGVRRRCENCSSVQVSEAEFEPTGTVYTFTVQRYAPPKPHALLGPWKPRPVAWIDLDARGPRVLAPVDCSPDLMSIGMRVRLQCHVGYVDEQQREVVVYQFVPEASA